MISPRIESPPDDEPDRNQHLVHYHFDTDYSEDAELDDGSHVRLRVIRASDKEILRAGFERLSPASRYRRFFTSKRSLTDNDLKYLTEVDGTDHFAIGAERIVGGTEEGLGVARFVRLQDEPECAEPAIAVVDDWQGKGLGRLLFQRLVAAASERGITRFRSHVLAENEQARNLLEEVTDVVAEHREGEEVEVDMHLPKLEPDSAPSHAPRHSPLYELFLQAARGGAWVRTMLQHLSRPAGTAPPDEQADSKRAS